MEAIASSYVAVSDTSQLRELLDATNGSNEPCFILGGGSNVLFTQNIDALVIHNRMLGIELVAEDDAHIWIKAGAGVAWHDLVMHCISNNWAGIENLALIPGSVGASPMQNIGAYGVEIKDVFDSLEAIHLKENALVTFDKEACSFGYRESVFKNKHKGDFIITSVTYRLNKQPDYHISYGAISAELERMGVSTLSIQAVAEAVMRIRRSKLPDPKIIGNAGSFFKNPELATEQFKLLKSLYPEIVGYPVNEQMTKVAAGWLMESCGWKGYRRGDAGCHQQQALVLVNYGLATGNEVYQLSEDIMQSVEKKFGIRLEREVNVY